ncbi:stage II sporulation protein P [Psychrobacillus sp. BL-248-WT-3]|uniref:stage II sporulation protein P n=1 Tax=Psychrobacillus sp. BL-248-WT-3 TaxID=2725306 RepID=UPI00146DAE60|nr:stage II sporulation protein P [Psychrobacillus sp. BL-248-WT-3]NME06873.1 stage II sporulation protein P [Psychrobacillus sp. BL-248-WT-3]
MRNQNRTIIGLLLLLFISPIIIATLSNPQQIGNMDIADEKAVEKSAVVYASTQNQNLHNIELIEPKKALLLFTHSHEAFIPIVKNETGQAEVYHSTSNITAFEDIIRNHFSLNSIETEFLGVDTMDELKKTNRTFPEAYNVVRPYLTENVQNNKYDIIIDLHRDSANRKNSTLTYNNETFGKIYFVVGEENPNYVLNKSYAQHLSSHLNELVPGISKGVIGKKGDHVDGIYNQDLANNMVLIELGGIDNTQEEINRTISVLAKAVSDLLQDEPTNLVSHAGI